MSKRKEKSEACKAMYFALICSFTSEILTIELPRFKRAALNWRHSPYSLEMCLVYCRVLGGLEGYKELIYFRIRCVAVFCTVFYVVDRFYVFNPDSWYISQIQPFPILEIKYPIDSFTSMYWMWREFWMLYCCMAGYGPAMHGTGWYFDIT